MSKYSGKSDLCDTCETFGVEGIITKYGIYLHNSIVKLDIKSEKDIMPFYPYLVALMCSYPETGGVIRLSSESFVDSEEKEILGWYMRDIKRYWRRCKRKKIPFNVEECLGEAAIWTPQDWHKEMAQRVEKLGEKATIQGIHLASHDYYRQKLYDDMVAVGWQEGIAYAWCFGYARYLNRQKNN